MPSGKNKLLKDPDKSVSEILSGGRIEQTRETLDIILSCIDLTTLNTNDTGGKVRSMCQKINELPEHFPGVPNVGAICVYPVLIPEVVSSLKASGVGIASVGACFPSSQSFLDVKVLECSSAVDAGATEIDIVISLGKFLEGKYQLVSDEIRAIKKAIGSTKLKVILETGLLPTPDDIYLASESALSSGADFIKTSTGKVEPAASPEAVLVMCEAIRNHFIRTGKKTGIKPAGGINTTAQALDYLSIVRAVLGEEWLAPGLFRIGASRLANRVLEDIISLSSGTKQELQYF